MGNLEALKKERHSGVELARIILMLMVVIHHLIVRGTEYGALLNTSTSFNSDLFQKSLIESLLAPGMTTFVLFAGFYGMKLRFKSIVSLMIEVLFYSLAIVLLFTLLDYPISLPAYIKSLFPITSGRWWFITSYFYLFLLSPFINRSLNSLSTRQDIFLLIALFLPNVLSGFVFGYSVIGTSQGHSIFTFIFYYVVGRMLRKHYQPSRGKLKYFLGYMLSVTLIFLGGVFIWHNFKSHIATLWGEQNNPLILLSAIAFFYVFYNMNIKSRFINWVAGSTLGVYLISDHPIVRAYLYENLFVIDTYSGTDTFFIPLFLMAVAIFVSCIVIDKIREAIFKPLLARIFGSEKIIEAEKKFDEIVRDIEVPKS